MISEEYCEDPISNLELTEAMKHMKTRKSPGIDSLSTEFYIFLGISLKLHF